MFKSTFARTAVLWLGVMSAAGCSQAGSAGPADSQGLLSGPPPSGSPTATDPAETPQGGATDPAETPQGGATDPAETPQGGATDPAETPQGGATDPAETPQGGATDGLPDGMSELEQRLISAMASVGVEGAGVWEHGFRDAHIAGDWRGRTAFVHDYEDPAAQTPGDVVDNVDLGSLSADVVATKTFGDVVRFPCGEVGYDVASLAGDGEPGSSHIPSAVELAQLLVPELSC
jgi:hypothetical protein